MRRVEEDANRPARFSSFPSVFSVANRIGWNAAWLLAARVGQQAILLLFTALVARQLGEVGLGQVAWVTAVLYLGNVFSTFGLDTVLLRQVGAERQTSTVPLVAALVLQLLLAGIFIGLLFVLPFAGQSAATVTGLRLYGWSLLPLAFLTLTSAVLRGHEQMGWLAALTLSTAVLQVVGTAVVFVLGGGFAALMGWLLAAQAASAGAGWWLCHRVLPGFGLNWPLFRWQAVVALAKTGFWLALLVGTAVLLQRLGILLLGWLGTEGQTGQLAAALRLVEAARLLPGAVMGALFPVLARERLEIGNWRLPISNSQLLIANYQKGLLGYGVLAAVGLWLLARPLVSLLFGVGYETAVPLLQILAWGVIPFTLSLPLSVELVVAGREKRVLLATFVVLVGTAVLTTAAFTRLGLPGVAWGLVLGEWLLVMLLLGMKRYRMPRI
ncbi:MAG: oligosaccharide flippase family protein [Anaerolineaceae bacterium]|nr:oligosaccharide flippase family protein [Anaerolineaceae bacterium]